MKLEDWRREIDEIDGEIVRLVDRRAAISRKIGALKAAAGLPVTDAAREDEILREIAARNPGALDSEALTRIYRRILEESRRLQIETVQEISKARQVVS